MSKKHFQALAWALYGARPTTGPDLDARHAQWADDVIAIGAACAVANPLFDRARFTRACETGSH